MDIQLGGCTRHYVELLDPCLEGVENTRGVIRVVTVFLWCQGPEIQILAPFDEAGV